MRRLTIVFMFVCAAAARALPASALSPLDSVRLAAAGSDTFHFPLKEVRVFGNRVTKDDVILHELTVHAGDTLTPEKILESQERVYNIGLFNSVNVSVWDDTVSQRAVMYILVSERWYIFPQLILGVKDRAWTEMFSHGSKLYAGLGGVDYNFRGMNEKLYAAFALGYDPWFDMEYDKIVLNRAQTLLLDLSAGTSRTRNLSDTIYTGGYSFNEIRYNAGAQLHYRASNLWTLYAGAGFQSLHLSNPNARVTLNPSGNDNAPVLSASVSYDTRDIVEYPMFGTWFQASASRTGFDGYIHYGRFSIDLRRYIPTWAGVSLCFRTAANLAYGGAVPVYDHVFLGLNERVRGDFFTQREGEDLAIGSAEIRIPVFSPRTYGWRGAPSFVPRQFTEWRFGVYAALFADAGATWFRDQRLADQQWSNGTGGGIDALFPYGIVARLEYAYGTARAGQFIFDIGASF